MCTVTVVPHATGVRLLCNRDEQRTRPAALPPRVHHLGDLAAIFPVDPDGGGTWIGCNAAGLAAALLNRNQNPAAAVNHALRSRGHIVRELLEAATLARAVEIVAGFEARAFKPFEVLVVQRQAIAVATSDGTSIRYRGRHSIDVPLLFTSSSLGDRLATPLRRRLFERLVCDARGGWLDGQAQFHDHQWPDRPEVSIRMERHDALTVSRTAIDLRSDGCEVRYQAPVPAPAIKDLPCCSLP